MNKTNRTKRSLVATLAEAHHRLLDDLQKVERIAQSSSGAEVTELGTHLMRLRTHLEEHFQLEEHDGYMQAVLERAPQLERTVSQLRGEHDQLRGSLAALLDESKGTPTSNADFPQKVQKWIERVRNHESKENMLVEEAFNREIATKD
jgi:iron-sulfur cluster repair protein YtfE (RIC family)